MLKDLTARLVKQLASMAVEERIPALNEIRTALHEVSPFAEEPVDLVLWVPVESVGKNEYNPNVVAPPEMKLLRLSVEADGYTQPIVVCPQGEAYVVVDGFHRHLVGRDPSFASKLHGHLPVTRIRPSRGDKPDRIASTIRHNRARGKHVVNAMSEIVVDLKRRNWSDAKIAIELGMDEDEVLRLKQVTGLAELFAEKEYSRAWTPEPPPGE